MLAGVAALARVRRPSPVNPDGVVAMCDKISKLNEIFTVLDIEEAVC
jgi:hypothetical protein